MCAAVFGWLLAAGCRPRARQVLSGTYPPVTVIVPVLDEAPVIDIKLTNLYELRYPSDRLNVLIVDGGSTDSTLEHIGKRIEGRANIRLIKTECRNKTAQVDAAVRESVSPWILMTDADALLAPDILERVTAAVDMQPALGVVGVPVRPHAAHPLERLHWRLADWLRARELDCGTASIVTAPCYFARRELVANLPSDTVADDVHVACRAMREGWRVGLVDTYATEMRSPRTFAALVRHKLRKADAYLREIFRFLPGVWQMRQPMRGVFLWRAFLLMVCPPLAVLAAGRVLWTVASQVSDGISAFSVAVGMASLMLARRVPRVQELALLAALGCMLVAVSALALVLYPLSRQTAAFGKILRPSDYRLSEGLE